jgi:hypothetical protein
MGVYIAAKTNAHLVVRHALPKVLELLDKRVGSSTEGEPCKQVIIFFFFLKEKKGEVRTDKISMMPR